MKAPAVLLALLSIHTLEAASFSQNVQPPIGRDFNGNIAAVGNFMAAAGGGRVHFYERNGGVWEIFQRKPFLTTPAANGGGFGTRILMPDRNTLLVSDPSFDAPTPTGGTNSDQGAVFVFGRDVGGDNNWGLIRQITATDHQLPNANLSKRLGEVMAVDDGRLVVSATAGTAIGNPKFFYVFEMHRGGTNQWGQVPGAKMEGTAFSGLSFGNAVSISGDLIVASSYLESRQATPTSPIESGIGALFFFNRNEGGADRWGLLPHGRRFAPDAAPADFFGHSISLSGNLLAVGASGRDLSSTRQDAGMIYLLERDRGGADAWGFTSDRLTTPDAAAGDGFGSAVRLQGHLLAGVSPGDDVAGTNGAGSATLFSGTSGTWTALPAGRFSIDNVPGIVDVGAANDKGLFLDPQRMFFWSRYSSSGHFWTEIDVSADFGPVSAGTLLLQPQGSLRFTPSRSGKYQLRTSGNLITWVDEGPVFSASAQSTIDLTTPFPTGVSRKYFRIEGR